GRWPMPGRCSACAPSSSPASRRPSRPACWPGATRRSGCASSSCRPSPITWRCACRTARPPGRPCWTWPRPTACTPTRTTWPRAGRCWSSGGARTSGSTHPLADWPAQEIAMLAFLNRLQDALDATRRLDLLGPLLLRLYLVPIFWMAGTRKLADMESTIAWFGNPDWGLGLPFPTLLAWLAALTEAGGAILLLLGLALRWVCIPLMVTMLVAIFTVHWEFGWQAIADPSAPFANERVLASA